MVTGEHEKWNEEMARRYNPDSFLTKTGFLIRWVGSLRMAATARFLDAGPNDLVLDVGCGPGNLLVRLSGSTIIGIDLSDTLLEQARLRVRGRPEIEILKADAEKLPYPINYFDRIVCSEVLEHVADVAAVLNEIHRVAKPGARVVLTLPNETLINRTKRIVIALRLKNWLAGDYPMSDDMMNAWHRAEIEEDWVLEHTRGRFEFLASHSIPFFCFAYHRILVFKVLK